MFKIYMTGYNSEQFIDRSIQSKLSQTYTNWDLCVVLDPYSDNKTYHAAKKYEDSNIQVHLNTERYGVMHNAIKAIELLKPNDDDIIVCVDSDDTLYDCDVLQKVYDKYSSNKMLSVCYGGIVTEPKQNTYFRKMSDYEIKNVRKTEWQATHLRTMKYEIFKNIDKNYLTDKNGKHFSCANDVALMVSAIELSGVNRVGYFDFKTYKYTLPEESNTDIKQSDAKNNVSYIRSLKPLKQLPYNYSLDFVVYIYGEELKNNVQKVMSKALSIGHNVNRFIFVELYDTVPLYKELVATTEFDYVSYKLPNDNCNLSTYGRNIGVLKSNADFVVLNDADIIMEDTFFDTIHDTIPTNRYFGSWSNIKYFNKSFDNYDKSIKWTSNKLDNSNGGSVVVNRHFFNEIGGYDPIYKKWGAEDNDFNARASAVMGYSAECANNTLYHLWHEPNKLSMSDDTRIRNNNILFYRINKLKHKIRMPK